MATSAQLKSSIKQIESAMKNKALKPTSLAKFQTQLDRLKGELASLNSPKPKKGVTKAKVLTNLQKLKLTIKADKELAGYKKPLPNGNKIDIEKDASEPAMKRGVRTSKGLKGNQYGTAAENRGRKYYEYRLNRADVKQPPKKYPKLEDGGDLDESIYYIYERLNDVEGKPFYEVVDRIEQEVVSTHDKRKSAEDWIDMHKYANGGYMAKGGGINYESYKNKSLEYIEGEIAHTERSSRQFTQSGDVESAKDRKEHAKKLWDIYYEKRSKIKMADGGSIPNNYRFKTPKDIWGMWDDKQKVHFLNDHSHEWKNKFSSIKIAKYSFDELPDDVRTALTMHTTSGQYAYGGEIGDGFTKEEMNAKLMKMFRDSFGFSVHNFSKEGGSMSMNRQRLIVDPNNYYGIDDSEIKQKLYFPLYKRDHDINFRIFQGGENTYFYFLLTSENGDEYIGHFGFKDRGDVPSDYITRFIVFLMEQYGLPFKVNHSVMESGGYMEHGGDMGSVKSSTHRYDK
jgi:hypothetical protein